MLFINSKRLLIAQIYLLVVCVLIVVLLLISADMRGVVWKVPVISFAICICGNIIAGVLILMLLQDAPPPLPGMPNEPQTSKTAKRRLLRTSAMLLFSLATSYCVWSAARFSILSFVPNIQISKIPPSDAGGPLNRATICGAVAGVNPHEYQVVIFAEANMWFVQPDTNAPMTAIQRDGRWCNSIHLGRTYAALLVRPWYTPPVESRTLPQVGGDIIASAIEEGR